MKTLRLREWSTAHALALTAPERDTLRTVLRATIQPTPGSTDRYDITPGNTIGAVLVGDTTLLVEPKIPISQVLFLLGYAADPSAWRHGDATLAAAADLVSGVAALFTTLCDRALRRGMLAGYHRVEADLSTVRGRINLAQQLRARPGLDLPLAVRFDEHDEDITENQLLLAAALKLRSLPLRGDATRRSLHRLVDSLQNVTALTYRPTAIPAVTWTRLNLHYRPAVELARLLLRMQSPDLAPGATETPALTIDMAALFETFVRAALRDALRASPAQFPSGDKCPPLALDTKRRVRLKPDLSYWPRGQCAFIGDVKYKRDTGPGHSSDLYQLLAYATAAQLPAATLIYADGPPEPHTHQIPTAKVHLYVQHLDLTKPPKDLLRQVENLSLHLTAPGTKKPNAA
ncbi:McrC family protein [Micromonospora psammae]|uniref:McrC family protein n=1 Tax=Micromonospora sp. CPCC 205556 TaxID=3122398 RepID=UPI002FEF35BA